MKTANDMSKESLQIRLTGQSHQIDANTLVNTLVHYTAILTEINNELGEGNRKVKINVNALSQGSFILDLEVKETLATMFSSGAMSYVADLISTLGGVLNLHRYFKGRPTTEEEVKSLITINGDIVLNNSTINIYNGKVVREAISKSIEAIDQEEAVESIELTSPQFKLALPKEEFKELIYIDFDQEDERPLEQDEYVDAQLVITGLKFEKGGRWDFLYNGFKINMIVKDDALMKEIDKGARFGKGDTVHVKMKIIKKYDPTINTYVNKTFKIEEFYEHIPNLGIKQGKLFAD